METLMDTAVLSRSWVRVSRSWESWVNGLLRTQTVADEEVLCAALRNGRSFKLYANTSCSSPVMKGELLVDGKVISRLVRTAASLLTEWVFEAEEIFTVEISLASGDLDHRVKLLSETDQCFATLTAPDTFSRNFIVSVLKNAVKQMKDAEMPAAEGMSGIWMDISGDMPGDHAEAMILKKRSLPNTGKLLFVYLVVLIILL